MPHANRWIVRIHDHFHTEYNVASLDLALRHLREALTSAVSTGNAVDVEVLESTPGRE